MSFSISGKSVFIAAVFVGGCVLVADFADQASTTAVQGDNPPEVVAQQSANTAFQTEPEVTNYSDQSSWSDDDDSDIDFADYSSTPITTQRGVDEPVPSVVTRQASSSERILIPQEPPPPS